MRIATSYCELPRKVQSTSTQAVKFKDGMIITAEDLESATRHPLAVFQTLVRAYFGCGVVCGLKAVVVRDKADDPHAADPTYRGAEGTASAPAIPQKPSFKLCIQPGVALACDGYPIELCKPVTLDLTPDPCCPSRTGKFSIAIRRCTSDDVPRADCGCGGGDCGCARSAEPRHQCTRIKDHVIIQVFETEKLPTSICLREKPLLEPLPLPQLCDCLSTCPDNCGCDDAWVLLADLLIDEKNGIADPNLKRRKFVKPTQCICDTAPR